MSFSCAARLSILSLVALTLTLPQVVAASPAEQFAQLEQSFDCCAPSQEATAPIRGRIQLDFETLFSGESGSWPFESFTHRGLFAMIAGYQPHHPQALHLKSGQITLEALHDRVNNPRVLRRHRDGFLLSYPLLIGPHAKLILRDTTLYLATYSGTALISQGELLVDRARITVWQGDQPAAVRGFRPFLVAWAGSRTVIRQSTLARLGFNAYLTRGLTLARHAEQPANLADPVLDMVDSMISETTTGIALYRASATIERSRFVGNRLYALDTEDSQFRIAHSIISNTRTNDGLRIRGSSYGQIVANRIDRSARAGVELSDLEGRVLVSGNIVTANGSEGIALQNINLAQGAPVLLSDNIIANNGRNGLYAEQTSALYLRGNQFYGHARYDVSYRNREASAAGELLMLDNTFGASGLAGLRTHGLRRVAFYNNRFEFSTLNQTVIEGDLGAFQSTILRALLLDRCNLEILDPFATITSVIPSPGLSNQSSQCLQILNI